MTIHISSAGPAGLAAAITAARAGQPVVVYEQRQDVGGRFHDDFQGLENWTTDGDVLEELASFGIEVIASIELSHALARIIGPRAPPECRVNDSD